MGGIYAKYERPRWVYPRETKSKRTRKGDDYYVGLSVGGTMLPAKWDKIELEETVQALPKNGMFLIEFVEELVES